MSSSAHDVYVATETWLTDQITNLELYLPNYNIFQADRKAVGETSSHGGILIATKPSLATERLFPEFLNQNVFFARITLPSDITVTVCGVYNPPVGSQYQLSSDNY